MPSQPDLLIEEWLPFETVGAESLRDNSAARKPPLNRLHVWWARRPLTISRAAITASLLPTFESVPAELRDEFPTRQSYDAWFLRLLGIHGDPIAARKLLLAARNRGEWISNPYPHERAFTVNPTPEDLEVMNKLLKATWGTDDLTVLDPFAGGGSIPFEARRYGFDTIANELNPVAAVLLRATLDYPAQFGPEFADEIKQWGKRWYQLVKKKLQPYFSPLPEKASGAAYLWARTVACPTTGKPVPLSPNWWLSKKKGKVAARMLAEPMADEPRFEIVRGDKIDFDPDEGTVSRGTGRSPWTGETIDGDYIKQEAQAGRMEQMLYAVAVKRRGGFDFRAPTEADLAAYHLARRSVNEKLALWEAQDRVPHEEIPSGSKTTEPMRYGKYQWSDMFSSRQLLALATLVEAFEELRPELIESLGAERASAVETYLAIMVDKAVIYNNRLCRFDPTRGIRSIFDRHDFAFVWSYAEFDASANLLPWAVNQIVDAYRDMAELLQPAAPNLEGKQAERGDLRIIQGSATDMQSIESSSVHAVVTDPPYYDNVMYAELSDFFYVWLKRTVGDLYPEWFNASLTNKDDEAVANPARFAGMRGSKTKLAARDYERKMAAAFREMHRVLREDGVLTVMFTHKQVEAWDTLASALIQAGFSIHSSWPVHTESEHSLHQARKNAAKSTILLTCRKREAEQEPIWWDDIEYEVRREVRERAQEYAAQGISGVDLFLSTFGPALSVISQQWPVLTSEIDEKTGDPLPLRPDIALDLAREEVVKLRKQGLVGRDVQFDPITDWYILAWDTFQAAQFPADEARKLALVLDLETEDDLVRRGVISKKGSYVELLPPKERRGRSIDPEAAHFDSWLDAVHTALLVYAEDGAAAAQTFLKRRGYLNDNTFKAAIQAMINAIPRTRKKDTFLRPEAEYLDKLRTAFFEELEVPPEETPEQVTEQLEMDVK